MSDTFLGRWSRRKIEVREGKQPEEPLPPSPVPAVASATQPMAVAEAAPAPAPEIPPPTLQDAAALTPESDFKPFMASNVTPEVKNAAMKKLFSDPHYNIMDRMDTYIDDYSQPDPIPESMLRQMVSAKFLNLFEEKEEDKGDPNTRAGDDADISRQQSVAQSPATPDPTCPTEPENAHTDLRLQPDDAAGLPDPGRGTA